MRDITKIAENEENQSSSSRTPCSKIHIIYIYMACERPVTDSS